MMFTSGYITNTVEADKIYHYDLPTSHRRARSFP